MPKIKVTLSIGFPGANREDILEIPNEEWNDCEFDSEKEELIEEWSGNYIDGGAELVD
jgi:hypothetical protein